MAEIQNKVFLKVKFHIDCLVICAYMGIFISNKPARQGEIRSQKKSKITRWKLQKAVLDISSEKGVEATTIEEIPSV